MSNKKKKIRRVHELTGFEDETDGRDLEIQHKTSSASEGGISIEIDDHSSSSSDLEDPFSNVQKVPTYGQLSQRKKLTRNRFLATQSAGSSFTHSTPSATRTLLQERHFNELVIKSSASSTQKRRSSELVKTSRPTCTVPSRRPSEPQTSGSSSTLHGNSQSQIGQSARLNSAKSLSLSKAKPWHSIEKSVIAISSDSDSEDGAFKKKPEPTQVESQYVSQLTCDQAQSVTNPQYKSLNTSDSDTDELEFIPTSNNSQKMPAVATDADKVVVSTSSDESKQDDGSWTCLRLSTSQIKEASRCFDESSQDESQSILNKADASNAGQIFPLTTDTEDDSTWDPFDCLQRKDVVCETDDETQDPNSVADETLVNSPGDGDDSRQQDRKTEPRDVQIIDTVAESQYFGTSPESSSDSSDWLIKPSQMPTTTKVNTFSKNRPFSSFSRQTNAGMKVENTVNTRKAPIQSSFSRQSNALVKEDSSSNQGKALIQSMLVQSQLQLQQKISSSESEQDLGGTGIFSYIRKFHETSPQKPIGSLHQKVIKANQDSPNHSSAVKRHLSKSPIFEANKRLKTDSLGNEMTISEPIINILPFTKGVTDEKALVYDDGDDEMFDDEAMPVIFVSPIKRGRQFEHSAFTTSEPSVNNFSKRQTGNKLTQVFGESVTGNDQTPSLHLQMTTVEQSLSSGSASISSNLSANPLFPTSSKKTGSEGALVYENITDNNRPQSPIFPKYTKIEPHNTKGSTSAVKAPELPLPLTKSTTSDELTQLFRGAPPKDGKSQSPLPFSKSELFIKREKMDEPDEPRCPIGSFSFTQQNDVYVIESDEEEDAAFAVMSQSFVDLEKEEIDKTSDEVQDMSEVIFLDPWNIDTSALCEEDGSAPVTIKLEVDQAEDDDQLYMTQKALEDARNSWSDDDAYVDIPDVPTYEGQGWSDGDGDDDLFLSLSMDAAKSPTVPVIEKNIDQNVTCENPVEKVKEAEGNHFMKDVNIKISLSEGAQEIRSKRCEKTPQKPIATITVEGDISPVPDHVLSQILEEPMEQDSQIVIADNEGSQEQVYSKVEKSVKLQKDNMVGTENVYRQSATASITESKIVQATESLCAPATPNHSAPEVAGSRSCIFDAFAKPSTPKDSVSAAGENVAGTSESSYSSLRSLVSAAKKKFKENFAGISFTSCEPTVKNSDSAAKDTLAATLDPTSKLVPEQAGTIDKPTVVKPAEPKYTKPPVLPEGFKRVDFDDSLTVKQLQEYLNAKYCDTLPDIKQKQSGDVRDEAIVLSDDDDDDDELVSILTTVSAVKPVQKEVQKLAVQSEQRPDKKATIRSQERELEIVENKLSNDNLQNHMHETTKIQSPTDSVSKPEPVKKDRDKTHLAKTKEVHTSSFQTEIIGHRSTKVITTHSSKADIALGEHSKSKEIDVGSSKLYSKEHTKTREAHTGDKNKLTYSSKADKAQDEHAKSKKMEIGSSKFYSKEHTKTKEARTGDKDKKEYSKTKDAHKRCSKSDSKDLIKSKETHTSSSTGGNDRTKNLDLKTPKEYSKPKDKHTSSSKSGKPEKEHIKSKEGHKTSTSSKSDNKEPHTSRSRDGRSKSKEVQASTSKGDLDNKEISKSKTVHTSSSKPDSNRDSKSKDISSSKADKKYPNKQTSSRSSIPDKSSSSKRSNDGKSFSATTNRTNTSNVTTSHSVASTSSAEPGKRDTSKDFTKDNDSNSGITSSCKATIIEETGWNNKLVETAKRKSNLPSAAVAKFQERISGRQISKPKKLQQAKGRARSKITYDDGFTTMTQSIETAKVDMYERVRKAKKEREKAKESKKTSEAAMVRDLFTYNPSTENTPVTTKEGEITANKTSTDQTMEKSKKTSTTSAHSASAEPKRPTTPSQPNTSKQTKDGSIISKAVDAITDSLRNLSQNRDDGPPTAPAKQTKSSVATTSHSTRQPTKPTLTAPSTAALTPAGPSKAVTQSTAEPPVKKRRINLPMAAKCSSTVPGTFRIVEQPTVQDPYELLKAMPALTLTDNGVNPTADDFLTVILQWNPKWLVECATQEGRPGPKPLPPIMEEAMKHRPPLLSSDTLWPVPDAFESPKEYFQIMMAHILHELWAATYQEWQKNRQWSVDASLVPVSRNDHSIVFQGLLATGQKKPVGEGDLVIVKVRNGGQVFGYVEHLLINAVRGRDMVHQKLGDLQEILRLKKLVMNIRIRMFYKIVPDCDFMRVEVVTSLVSVLRQIEALVTLARNPLCKDLLELRLKTFLPTDTPIDKNLEKLYNGSQARVIHAVTTLLLQPYINPRVSLIQGPPGTGKSYTILRIIMNTVFRKTVDGRAPCLMLCAPSNAAVDELVRRVAMENDVIAKTPGGQLVRMVRIGNMGSMCAESLPYSLDTLVKVAWEKRKLVERMQKMPMSIRKEILAVHEQLPKLRTELEAIQKLRNTPEQQAQIKKLENDIALLEKKESKFTGTGKKSEPNEREKAQVCYDVLATAHIVCCTLNSAGNRIISEAITFGYTQRRNNNYKGPVFSFTGVIIDEACQCVEVETLIPLQYCMTKLVLIGDPKQLPPTVISQEAETMKFSQSLFERLDNHFRLQGQQVTHLLDTQYRMHPEIAMFPSLYIYDGYLKTFPGVAQRRSMFPHRNYLVYDVAYGKEEYRSMSVANPSEVEFVVTLVQYLVKSKVKKRTIGIITPYKQQKGLFIAQLRQSNLELVDVGTVDGFQGQEKDVIIVSCVRAHSNNGGIGFVADTRRMNVALTRAKYACYVVGHLDTLQVNKDWGALIKDAYQRKVVAKVQNPSRKEEIIQMHCNKQPAKAKPNDNRQNLQQKDETKLQQVQNKQDTQIDQITQRITQKIQLDKNRQKLQELEQIRQNQQVDQNRKKLQQLDQSRQRQQQQDHNRPRHQQPQSRQYQQYQNRQYQNQPYNTYNSYENNQHQPPQNRQWQQHTSNYRGNGQQYYRGQNQRKW